jgi:ParB-like nuclease domain
MGQTVYVLMSNEGSGKNKAWRPVAVVSNPDLATQYMEHGKDVDWVPLELDDVQNISAGNVPTFQPRKTTPGEDKATELNEQIEATIKRMQKIIDDQQDLIKKLMKGKKSSLPEVTGAAEEDKIPPRPVERGGQSKLCGLPKPSAGQPFAAKLDAQGIADYIETYAVHPVDNEFVYEMFRGSHAVLKLVPIASLREGSRDHNLKNKKTEDKYLKQDLKTQPPVVVENGEVVDGNHRLRANKRRGLTHMWCYAVTNEETQNGDTDGSGGQEG